MKDFLEKIMAKAIYDNLTVIAIVFGIILVLYVAEFFIKRKFKQSDGDVSEKSKVGRILTTVLSVIAIFLNLGLCTYLLIAGADIEDVLPLLLLALLETLI